MNAIVSVCVCMCMCVVDLRASGRGVGVMRAQTFYHGIICSSGDL
jgi:hypothetical protein